MVARRVIAASTRCCSTCRQRTVSAKIRPKKWVGSGKRALAAGETAPDWSAVSTFSTPPGKRSLDDPCSASPAGKLPSKPDGREPSSASTDAKHPKSLKTGRPAPCVSSCCRRCGLDRSSCHRILPMKMPELKVGCLGANRQKSSEVCHVLWPCLLQGDTVPDPDMQEESSDGLGFRSLRFRV